MSIWTNILFYESIAKFYLKFQTQTNITPPCMNLVPYLLPSPLPEYVLICLEDCLKCTSCMIHCHNTDMLDMNKNQLKYRFYFTKIIPKCLMQMYKKYQISRLGIDIMKFLLKVLWYWQCVRFWYCPSPWCFCHFQFLFIEDTC